MAPDQSNVPSSVGRGIAAGIAGTAVMTAFQKLVEMPVTGRRDSYAPANFAQRVLRIKPETRRGRKRLNYIAHFALGAMWGSAYGIAAHRGLRGQKAVAAVFATVYPGDVALNTGLRLYKPTRWDAQDVVIDVGEKLIQAQATGAIYDRFLAPASPAADTPVPRP